MFGKRRGVEVLSKRRIKLGLVEMEQALVAVPQGLGRLRLVWSHLDKQPPPYEEYLYQLRLGDVPLAQLLTSGCPTCASMLAAGYGLAMDDRAVLEAAEAVRAPHADLDAAAQALSPLLQLLPSGVYVLTLGQCCPTDGSGRFFWDVPNDFTYAKATADLYDGANYRVLPAFPYYIYPTQSTDCLNEQRVAHYRRLLQVGEALPAVIAYELWGYMSVLLDGHHRACACALEGTMLPCVSISKLRYNYRKGQLNCQWPDGTSIPIDTLGARERKLLAQRSKDKRQAVADEPKAGSINNRQWPPEYQAAARRYPTCFEAGALALYPEEELTAEGLMRMALSDERDETETAASLLGFLGRRQRTIEQAKQVLWPYTDPKTTPYALRREAFAQLAHFKDDEDIEDLFVAELVENERRDDPIRVICDHYWDE